MAASPLPSRGPKRGQNCYVTRALPGVRNAKSEGKIRMGGLTATFLGDQKRAELLCNYCILGGLQSNERTKSELAASGLPSRGPKRGRNCYITPAFSRVPNAKCWEKIRISSLTPAF